MIEINLIPRSKQRLLNARRRRLSIINLSSKFVIGALIVLVLLVVYLYGVQSIRNQLVDADIEERSQQLRAENDLSSALTIQNQLEKLPELHANKNMMSRVLMMLTAVNPAAPNNSAFSSISVNTETNTVTMDAQANGGFDAAETLKKTILDTNVSFKTENGDVQRFGLAENVETTDLSFGEDASGQKVLRFTVNFEYNSSLTDSRLTDVVIERPDKKNVTDSKLSVPEGLFGGQESKQ